MLIKESKLQAQGRPAMILAKSSRVGADRYRGMFSRTNNIAPSSRV
ncbi:predicted protein [Chaetomium globosum CBS 148.51]|uniref:Uncharacterized protein n=1 Tax=Chaetomium globosum (strain ATCC 6205 / CBS 148.51 / DSM 1962 / NBRC 6347 / NRRL 1970) TaxID=306901 RepID=Q2HE28_CHAGB|nr:uncharacterized protein CHGG_01526 [Chaetomium globosum CBS 148.51]EAQ93291.1 predicted protein [Chaetomium globosum CBS 148.51]